MWKNRLKTVLETFLFEMKVESCIMLDLYSSSLAVFLARRGHYQLCPGMTHIGVGIGKLQMSYKGEYTVVVNGFISIINTAYR